MSPFIIICTAIGCLSAGFVAGFLVCSSRVVLPDNADIDNWSDYP